MQRTIALTFLAVLYGCGADVAGSAAAVAALKAKEAEQAKKTQDEVKRALEAASQDAQKRLDDADKAAQ